ncbi:DUF2507 domain-containing protein [Gracilibacillus sp. YIM 98692]|uniref:DUF2507 domain-containing protein n=1 Tax=Gracilibacillus sp. YIM 98692 TaxID=2663532 RepID=UPI0013D68993|nr:DUF2507 domain-containing protein [Gracilibacillus sp. YIM 98692]
MSRQTPNMATVLTNLQTTSSGYDIIRYIGLPDMLGEESDLILYVLGKNLARHTECGAIEEVEQFFVHAGWGDLQLEKEKRKGHLFRLDGDIVLARFQTIEKIDFQLEAGFLAASMEHITGKSCECLPDIKKNYVILQVIHQ